MIVCTRFHYKNEIWCNYFAPFSYGISSTNKINNEHLAHYIHICTYITGHYNPSVRIIDLVFHTIYVVCVNFIHKRRNLQFKVDSKLHILRNFPSQFYLRSEFLPEFCWEEITEEILFCILFGCHAWGSNTRLYVQ